MADNGKTTLESVPTVPVPESNLKWLVGNNKALLSLSGVLLYICKMVGYYLPDWLTYATPNGTVPNPLISLLH
jgi:hypothetical protein